MITASLRYEAIAASPPISHTTPESVRITAEIAERLAELEEIKYGQSFDLVNRLSTLAHISPRLYRVVVGLLHGNIEVLTDSCNALASRRGRTKQCIHAEHITQLATVAKTFPQLAAVIEAIRTSATAHEDQQSHADALRQSVEVTREF